MIGADTINSIAAMKTEAGMATVGGPENAAKLIEKGVKHLGLVYADNAFTHVGRTGSVETLQRQLDKYNRMSPEMLGVDTLEEKNMLLNVMEKKFADSKRVMEKKSKESETARKLTVAFTSYDDNNDFAAAGAAPLQGAYSKESQGNYDKYLALAVESGIPNETMFEHPENYRIAKFTWIQDGVIPKQAITANRNQMNSTEPFERARGARQLDRFLRDPEIPTHLKDEAMKIISPEQREYAAVINSLDGDFPQIDRLKELHESPINRKDGAANWDAWSDPKKWDSKKSLATFLDDNNYVSDKDQISPHCDWNAENPAVCALANASSPLP